MNILWIEELSKDNIALAGGKGANLGELLKGNFPVPNAFVITSSAFWSFLEETKTKQKIFETLAKVDINNSEELNKASEIIKEAITEAEIPWQMEIDILDAYRKLGSEEFVAVRSSATAEDLPAASFAGQQETYLNIKGEKALLENIKKCWASLYTPRAIFYRVEHGFQHEKVGMAVVVQKMINSDLSGVIFTSHPITGDKKVVIEAGYGLGETTVGGKITPDTYVVDQLTLKLEDKKISAQKIKYTRSEEGRSIEVDVPEEVQASQKLTDEQIYKLAEYGKRIEEFYTIPMDVEWCIENSDIYIVQARPITALKPKAEELKEKREVAPYEGILKGLPASPGIASGKVVIIKDSTELAKVKKGNVLVTTMTSPDMVPAMRRACAIVTDEGGMTCHAAIVSRELGIPCIVGTGNATGVLQEGMEITVDAKTGVVYEGAVELRKEVIEEKKEVAVAEYLPITATKILLNIGVPEKAEEYSKLPVQGVGLMREEFIVSSYIGKHPCALIERGEENNFIEVLAEGIEKVAKAFYPRFVVLRTSDFKTNEYRALEGGEKFEALEANPMLGWRGCSRYTSKEFESAFRLELKAIKKVRDKGLTNLWVMLPFVRTVEEVKKITSIMREEGLERSADFKLWLMAEVPSNIFLADKFAELVDGFSIGSNDLTQLILGADRDSEILAKLGYFDERNEAVKIAIEHLIKVAHEKNCTVSICGQAPSIYPEFTEFLVRAGIDSISLNPDAVKDAIRLVASIEQKLILEKVRK
ncbi:MAG: phosphoenolpyruvate synthase [Candidatus Thermoplasmatota archaeon]|nr:phosphoenolpyruvate synthase [Candidatus Thermoplasmatota archaeon]